MWILTQDEETTINLERGVMIRHDLKSDTIYLDDHPLGSYEYWSVVRQELRKIRKAIMEHGGDPKYIYKMPTLLEAVREARATDEEEVKVQRP